MPDVTITTMPPSSDAVLRLPTELTIYTVAETRSAWLPWLTSQLSSKCGFATLLDPLGWRPASAGLGALSGQRAASGGQDFINAWLHSAAIPSR